MVFEKIVAFDLEYSVIFNQKIFLKVKNAGCCTDLKQLKIVWEIKNKMQDVVGGERASWNSRPFPLDWKWQLGRQNSPGPVFPPFPNESFEFFDFATLWCHIVWSDVSAGSPPGGCRWGGYHHFANEKEYCWVWQIFQVVFLSYPSVEILSKAFKELEALQWK